MLKCHGGIVGLSQDVATLDRPVTTTPHLSRIERQYLNSFPQTSTSFERSEHYHLSGENMRKCDKAPSLNQRQPIQTCISFQTLGIFSSGSKGCKGPHTAFCREESEVFQ